MDYTNISDQIVFLKDADIVNDMSAKTISGNVVITNGIPSYDLFRQKYDEVSSDVEFLSNEISVSERRNLSVMRYFGTVQLSDKYNCSDGIAQLTGNTLFGLLKTNMYINKPEKELRAGFTFRAIGNDISDYIVSSDNAQSAIVMHDNDYIILNKNVAHLSGVSLKDVDLIKDYDLSILNVQNQIISNDHDIDIINDKISYLSSTLSATVKTVDITLDNQQTIEEIAEASFPRYPWNVNDILIVRRLLCETSEGTDKFEHTAYVFNGQNWKAADGNYSASNVFFTKDMTITYQFGKYTIPAKTGYRVLSSEIKGKNVHDFITNAFSEAKDPTVTKPTIKLATSGNNDEVGKTYKIPAATLTITGIGSYEYGPATGISFPAGNTSISREGGSTIASIKDMKLNDTLTLSQEGADVTYLDNAATYTYSASAQHKEGADPYNNLGTLVPSCKIVANTLTASASATFTGWRKVFIGSIATDPIINSSIIRSLTGFKSTAMTKTVKYTGGDVKLVDNAKQIIIALPQGRRLVSVLDANNVDITPAYNIRITVQVSGAKENANMMDYSVYIYKPASISTAEQHKITIA